MILDARLFISDPEFEKNIAAEMKNEFIIMLNDKINQFITNDEECWGAIQARTAELVRESVAENHMKDIWGAFHGLQEQIMQNRPEKSFEDKLDALAKNMDALYLEIQELKRERIT